MMPFFCRPTENGSALDVRLGRPEMPVARVRGQSSFLCEMKFKSDVGYETDKRAERKWHEAEYMEED